jgi:uncharacterized membrane protein YphA (DoxX/SURF4 family)
MPKFSLDSKKRKKIFGIYRKIALFSVAAIWLFSAAQKILHIEDFAYKLSSYKLLYVSPYILSHIVVITELFLCALLLLDLQLGKILSCCLLLIYIGMIVNLWVHDIYTTCGCFSVNNKQFGSAVAAGYPKDIARDVFLILVVISTMRFQTKQDKTPSD